MKNIIVIILMFCIFSTGCQNNSSSENLNTSTTLNQYESSNENSSSTNNSSNTESSSTSFKNESNTVEEYTIENDVSIDGIVEIREKMFLSQVNDIYLNSDEYVGKNIKYEGYFATFYDESTEKNYYFVLRNGPGCCGNDSNVGFEIQWNDTIPEENQWLEITGTLEAYEENGYEYLRLLLKSFKILAVRGNDTVLQ